YVNEIARYVAKAVIPNVKCATASTNADGIYVAVVQSPTDSLYALPGGWIILGNKAIATVQSEDALAGLIAREIVFSLC
ncbi:hypothetical protein Q0M54_14820, partial [Staphylococcus aureus]|nr:hypothetical protein [Staphylococcus aureus]